MRKNAGFTLLEVMVTVAVISIVSVMAGYSFFNGMGERRVQKCARELYGGIQRARSEAVERGEDVTILFGASDYIILDADGNLIWDHTFPEYVRLYEVTGDGGTGAYTFNARGMKTVNNINGRVRIRYVHEGPLRRGVRVTSVGGISLIDENDANWLT